MKKRYLSLCLLTLTMLSSCIVSKIHNFNIIEGKYTYDVEASLNIEIIEDKFFQITELSLEFSEISKDMYMSLDGINTIQDLSKNESQRTYFTIEILITIDNYVYELSVDNVRKFANAKEMYRMDFESELGSGAIELYIYNDYVNISFYPSFTIIKLIKEDVR